MEQIDLNQIKLEDTGIFEKGKHRFCFAFSQYAARQSSVITERYGKITVL